MKIGLARPAFPPPPGFPDIDAAFQAERAERLGFESFWCGEHGVSPIETSSSSPHEALRGARGVAGYMDPLIALARASAVTKHIKLGTAILILPQRHPLTVAKELSTLDFYSGGRFCLGIGAGWNRGEADVLGVDFDHRWSQAHEAVIVLKGLWTQALFEFHGRYYDFPPVACEPKPAQKPHPPIYLGGRAPNVFKRIVAWGDGWLPGIIPLDELSAGRRTLDTLAKAAGRDPQSLEISTYISEANPALGADLLKRYEDAGADRILLMPERPLDEAELGRSIDRLASIAFG